MKNRIKLSFVVSIVFCLFLSIPARATTVQNTYDDLNRLIRVEYDDGSRIEYTYDAAGNRLSKVVTLGGDSDSDGLSDTLENATCTDAYDADTDDDGIPDGVEDSDHNGVVDYGETDPCNIDTDGDGIQDGTEAGYELSDLGPDTDTGIFVADADPSTTTNSLNNDTDGDSLLDGEEDTNYNGMVDAGETDPYSNDSDGDGVADNIDNCPTIYNSNQADSDVDGFGAACDCNDNDNTTYPGAPEVCGDGIDQDCDGSDLACEVPTAVATPKTIEITIPGSKCFTISVDNPSPYDVTMSPSIDWIGTVPSDVTFSGGSITVLAGQSRSVNTPCFDVGPDAEPDDYDLDIIWTGTDSIGNPIEVNTDPTISLVYGGGGGGAVGGTAFMADKIELLAPWIALGTLILLSIGIVASRRFRKKFKE